MRLNKYYKSYMDAKPKKQPKKPVAVMVYMDPELRRALKTRAATLTIPMNALICNILMYDMDKRSA